MKLVIAGTRTMEVPESFIQTCLDQFGLKPTTIISGACGIDFDDPNREMKESIGIDGSGELWAKMTGTPISRYYAAWKRHGKPAGPIRNGEMAMATDAALVIWDGLSNGSNNMINQMVKSRKPIYQVIFRGQRHG